MNTLSLGKVKVGSLLVKGTSTLTGAQTHTGAATFSSTAHIVGAATLDSTLAVTGAANFTGITSFGKTIKASSASAPTAAAGASSGTSPPAPVVVAGSNDMAGSITFGSGSGSPALGDYVDVTFGAAYTSTPKTVLITALNSATALKGPIYASGVGTTGFSINLAIAAATSQGNTIYAVNYLVVE